MAGAILLVLGLIVVNGLLAGAEIAVVAVRRGRIDELAADGSRAARALLALRSDAERFLATVQVGITLVGAGAAAFGGARFAGALEPAVARVPGLAPYADGIALVVVVLAISYLSVVVGELVPKSLALRISERYALLAAPPLLVLSRVMKPAVWLLARSSNLLLAPFHDRTTFTESRVSPDELRRMVDEASRDGAIDRSSGEIASRAIEFAELTAEEVMVHRRFVRALPVDARPEDVERVLLGDGHQRIPVYEGSIDHVVGYVSWRDVLTRLWASEPIDVAAMMRPPFLVPESRKASDLLAEMREKRIHLAIVLDEHGGLAGIVTLEDLLEELVGEIASEYGKGVTAAGRREGERVVFPGTVSIRDVERTFGVDLRAPPHEYDTVGGWCVGLAGDRIPRTGERFRAERYELEVLDASPRRVRSVAVSLAHDDAEDDADG